MITGLIAAWLVKLFNKTPRKLPVILPIRVVEREMNGCMAHTCTREDFGTVIRKDRRPLIGAGADPVSYWLIRWDKETGRGPSWLPACFFRFQDEDGIFVREM